MSFYTHDALISVNTIQCQLQSMLMTVLQVHRNVFTTIREARVWSKIACERLIIL